MSHRLCEGGDLWFSFPIAIRMPKKPECQGQIVATRAQRKGEVNPCWRLYHA